MCGFVDPEAWFKHPKASIVSRLSLRCGFSLYRIVFDSRVKLFSGPFRLALGLSCALNCLRQGLMFSIELIISAGDRMFCALLSVPRSLLLPSFSYYLFLAENGLAGPPGTSLRGSMMLIGNMDSDLSCFASKLRVSLLRS